MRRLPVLLLLVALFWQALAPAGPAWASDAVQRWLHDDLHARQASHHHHEDGSIHHEDAGGAIQHAHPAFDLSPALPAAGWSGANVSSRRAAPSATGPRYAGPVLASPLRPPQAG